MSLLETLRREPVRKYLYSIVAAVLALLVSYGLVSNEALPLFLALAVALLAAPSPVESLRSKVSPVDQEGEVIRRG